jgi:8-oxo-dGTP diphosphatase
MAETLVDPGEIVEPHLHVVAAVIWHRRDAGRMLIARRQQGTHLADYWELPGGKLEGSESPWQGLLRELREELGIRVTDGRPFLKVYHRYPERNVLLDTWIVDGYRGEVTAMEGQPLAWVEVAELENYRFPAADIPILAAIKRSARAETRRSD